MKVKKPFKHDCMICGKATAQKIWIGGYSPKGKAIESPICSELCFKKACALFLPTEEGRANARLALLEMGISEFDVTAKANQTAEIVTEEITGGPKS
jgi:hypothetical protein